MLKKISISTLLIVVLCSYEVSAQDEMTIPVGDSAIVFSPLKYLNAYADAVGIDNLSEVERSESVRLRLWGSLSHSCHSYSKLLQHGLSLRSVPRSPFP